MHLVERYSFILATAIRLLKFIDPQSRFQMINKALLALYAYEAMDFVYGEEHRRCCDGWEKVR